MKRIKKFDSFTLYIIIFTVLIPFFSSCGYNTIVSKQEAANKSWAVLENDFQQRTDLADNLTDDPELKALAGRELLKKINLWKLNASRVSLLMAPGHLNQKYISEFENVQTQLDSSLIEYFKNTGKEYKSGTIVNLQKKLEGIDQKINKSIAGYNDAAKKYNASRKNFWHFLVASVAGFKSKGYFQKNGKS